MYLQPTLLKGYVVVLDREKAQYGRIIDFIFYFVVENCILIKIKSGRFKEF